MARTVKNISCPYQGSCSHSGTLSSKLTTKPIEEENDSEFNFTHYRCNLGDCSYIYQLNNDARRKFSEEYLQ